LPKVIAGSASLLQSKKRRNPRKAFWISSAQLSLECHMSRQIVSAVHNCPAAQLIFADLAGMVMVNVIAGGRSYRKIT
jgi:hypothetical protein